MSQDVTILSITANTPVDVYYCDAMSANCVFVSGITTVPYSFQVPDPYDNGDFVVKIIDDESCEVGHTLNITPTPTPSVTPTITPTQTTTPTNTPTPTITPTITPSITPTQTTTPTPTLTPTPTPVVASHLIGNKLSVSSANTCTDIMTIVNYYTYISQANTIPVIGATIYQTNVNGVLYNPYNGFNRYLKMRFGSNNYVVLINTVGNIVNYIICP